jgi:hypothetical protein
VACIDFHVPAHGNGCILWSVCDMRYDLIFCSILDSEKCSWVEKGQISKTAHWKISVFLYDIRCCYNKSTIHYHL